MPTQTPGWVYIDREHGVPIAIGPYSSEAAAVHAMENAPLIEGLVQEDAIDCWATTQCPHEAIAEDPSAFEVIVPDESDPDQSGL